MTANVGSSLVVADIDDSSLDCTNHVCWALTVVENVDGSNSVTGVREDYDHSKGMGIM